MSDKGFRKTIALTGFLLVMLSVVFAKGGGEVPAEGGGSNTRSSGQSNRAIGAVFRGTGGCD
jgi:hypothetical protein